MRRMILMGAVVALACSSMFLAPTAGATTTKIPYSCLAGVRIAELDPGIEWIGGYVVHARGWTGQYQVKGDDYCQGVSTLVVDWNLNGLTGTGGISGRFHYDLEAFEGGFDGTFAAAFDYYGPELRFAGSMRGTGYGELTGWQIRADVFERQDDTTGESGYVFMPAA